jgi:cell division septal protein FtsQ
MRGNTMQRLRLKNRNIRKRKKRKGANEWVVLLVIFFFIVMGVEFYEFMDKGYPVQSFGIKCSRVNPEEIRGAVELNPGTSMFKLRLKEMTSRLNKDPRIKSVHIFKNLFEGKVEIEVNERVPFIKILESGTGKCLEADADGVIIGEAENISSDVPLITGLSISDSSSYPRGKDAKILGKAIEILKMCTACGISMDEISEVNFKNKNDIIFFTTGGIEFHLGNEDQIERLKKVSIILAGIKNKGISVKYVDLRFGEEAIIR